MGWFGKIRADADAEKRSVDEGLWRKCDECGEARLAEEFAKNLQVCPACGYHYQLDAPGWVNLILDPSSFVERDPDLVAADPLAFKDQKGYRDRSRASRKKTGFGEAMLSGDGKIRDRDVSVGFFVFQFMGGSMGSVVGEKVARVFERAAERRCPAIIFNASGGARMQEGVYSLMQMAKTSAAIARLRATGQPYISVLLNPTTGGVAASFAFLGDVIVAEPKALIGFAGPRVIEQTIRQKLPEGFQRSEFLVDHGMVDFIAPRHEMRSRLALLLDHLAG
ncbi:MAG: acetyl-CoA carboxylase carboxyltransferase subunit beta [Deltaproteobacteria bacterium]|nr:acetyl-CoA carboxylase carboxyltransferase subunit beta [Deltaproteobacteria bacterium]